jgi:hypothetical protein
MERTSMPETDEQAEILRRQLDREIAEAEAMEPRIETVENGAPKPPPKIDHATDGGVI